MSGLIYKEWITIWRVGKLLLLILLVSAAVPLLWAYGMAYVGMLPFMLIQLDENCRWGRLSVMLPYSNLQLVLSKYLMGWGMMLASALISTIAVIATGGAPIAALSQGLFYVAAASLLSAVICPVAFRFGTQRGRFFFIFLVVIFAIGAASFRGELQIALNSIPSFGLLMLPLAVPVNAISIYLSQKWYRRGVRA